MQTSHSPTPVGALGTAVLTKVQSLQPSFCYMRTVRVVPLGSHTPWKWVTCSVSVAKKLTCTLPGWNSCFYCRRCASGKELLCVCLPGRPRLLFLCNTFLQEPSASWLLMGDLLQWVSSDLVLHLWALFCSLAFVVLVILQIRHFFSLLLLSVRRSISVCCLSFICPQAWGTSFPAYLDCKQSIAVYSFLLVPTQLLHLKFQQCCSFPAYPSLKSLWVPHSFRFSIPSMVFPVKHTWHFESHHSNSDLGMLSLPAGTSYGVCSFCHGPSPVAGLWVQLYPAVLLKPLQDRQGSDGSSRTLEPAIAVPACWAFQSSDTNRAHLPAAFGKW